MKHTDKIGLIFNRLTIIEIVKKETGKEQMVICLCSCKTQTIKRLRDVISGRLKSCGCLQKETVTTHGMKNSPEYQVWVDMLRRCNNKSRESYKYYEAKGITVCKEWEKFENFYNDMGKRPDGLTIERLDYTKGYYKENCIWASVEVQNRNKSDTRKITINNVTKSLAEWCREYKIGRSTITYRLSKGYSIVEAITIPTLYKGEFNNV